MKMNVFEEMRQPHAGGQLASIVKGGVHSDDSG